MNDPSLVSPMTARPEHVPESVVYDFDMFRDAAYIANPHDRILELIRSAPPVFWTPRNGGHWMMVSYEANFKASRDTDTFSNDMISPAAREALMAMIPPGGPHIPNSVPINLDPPEHGKYRLPLQRVFSPATINGLKDSIRELAAELIDSVAAQGDCEFMAAIAEPLPVKVFLKMLGLPLERLPEYRVLAKKFLRGLSESASDMMAVSMRMRQVADIMNDVLLARKANPRDDIISMLWKVEVDGKPSTLEDMENYAVLLFIAGLDTVMNGMGHGIRHLAQDLATQDQLRAEPALIADATEELLRRYTFTVPPRRVKQDTVFLDVPMKADERVMLFLPAADLDGREFDQPALFDFRKDRRPHIAFNAGPHRCLGSHLARIELTILYEEMLKRLPSFRLDPDQPPQYHVGHVIGLDTLHLRWDRC